MLKYPEGEPAKENLWLKLLGDTITKENEMTISIFQKHTNQRPSLIGGDPPPKGFKWRVYSLTDHHIRVLDALATSSGLNPSKALRLIIDHYQQNNQELINLAFKDSKKKHKGTAE